MEGDRQLDDTERRAEMPARPGDRSDDLLADLGGQFGELNVAEAAEVGRTVEAGEDGHAAEGSLIASECLTNDRPASVTPMPSSSLRCWRQRPFRPNT